MHPFEDPRIAEVFDGFDPELRKSLRALRDLIFEEASRTPGVGPISERLKWGQPAYLTEQSKSGTPLRLGPHNSGGYALFVHCQSRVIPDARALFPEEFRFDGNRAVVFEAAERPNDNALRTLIRSALTYHSRKAVQRMPS